MTSSVVPLSEVPAELLRAFLGGMGVTPEVVDWRYLDRDFNRGRNRGYAWLPRNRIQGMIGLIPFRVGTAGLSRSANWSSDWILANPTAHPGMGIVLLRRAIEESGDLFALGGNENTRKILPRLARHTVPDAAITLHLPLRSGALLERAARWMILRGLPKPRLLYMIPLRWVRKSARGPEVTTQQGVAPRIAALLEGDENGWRPYYDLSYLEWQIGRSPLLQSYTSYSPSKGEPLAAALYWRQRASSDFWRLAVWCRKDGSKHLASAIRTAVAEIYQQKGVVVSALLSRLDIEARAVFHSAGFLAAGRRRPLYLCSGQESDGEVPELRGLSYLDTDLAYRF